MPKQTKTTLKGYFETGDIPNQSQYVDLIDSNVNFSESNQGDIELIGNISVSNISASGAITGSIGSFGMIQSTQLVSHTGDSNTGLQFASDTVIIEANDENIGKFTSTYVNLNRPISSTISTGVVIDDSLKVNDYINTLSHITASGNISSSGTLIANEANIIGNITASGNISASGDITCNNLTPTSFTPTNISASGYISASAVNINGDNNALTINCGDGNIALTAISTDEKCTIRVQDNGTSDTNVLGMVAKGENLLMRVDEGKFVVKIQDDGEEGLIMDQEGSLFIHNDITASGDIQATYFRGDGSNLTNLPAAGYSSGDSPLFTNITASGDISASGDIVATNITGSKIGNQHSSGGHNGLDFIQNPDYVYMRVNDELVAFYSTAAVRHYKKTIFQGGVQMQSSDIDMNGRDITNLADLTSTGTIKLTNLPTSDPGVADVLWRDGTDLKVSIG